AGLAGVAKAVHRSEDQVGCECVEGVGHGRLREWVGQCIALGRLNNRGAWCSLARLGRTRQAVDIDPRSAASFQQARQCLGGGAGGEYVIDDRQMLPAQDLDRKSTSLNSSHMKTSYAVFCLKKKKSIQKHLNKY